MFLQPVSYCPHYLSNLQVPEHPVYSFFTKNNSSFFFSEKIRAMARGYFTQIYSISVTYTHLFYFFPFYCWKYVPFPVQISVPQFYCSGNVRLSPILGSCSNVNLSTFFTQSLCYVNVFSPFLSCPHLHLKIFISVTS